MAYVAANLGRVSAGGHDGPDVFTYTTTDTAIAATADDYFNDATDLLAQGDFIMITGTTGGTLTSAVAMVATATGAASVTCLHIDLAAP